VAQVSVGGGERSVPELLLDDVDRHSLERDLANVLDDAPSVEVWARLHPRDFELRYRGGTYNPDFLAAEDGQRWVIEAKADRDLATENVQAKRRAAREWASLVNADERVSERWGYLLVSETDLRQAKDDWRALVHAAQAA
jgi:type III restriction enzyme